MKNQNPKSLVIRWFRLQIKWYERKKNWNISLEENMDHKAEIGMIRYEQSEIMPEKILLLYIDVQILSNNSIN